MRSEGCALCCTYRTQPTDKDIAPWHVFGFLHKKKVKQRRCLLQRYKSVSYLINIHSLERCLQKLKIVNVFMLQLRLKFYLLQTNAAWEEHVHELAVGCSWKETRTGQVWVWRYHVWLSGAGQEGAPRPQPSCVCSSPHCTHTSWSTRAGCWRAGVQLDAAPPLPHP